MDLNGTRIVLTGAASGIGLALLRRLAERRVQVLAVDLNASALQAACSAAGSLAAPPNGQSAAQITPYLADMGQPEAIDQLFEAALSQFGGIDLFIANAGFAYFEELSQPDWAHLERIYRVNTLAPLYILEKMQALPHDRPHKVVITASAMAHLAVPGYAAYASTKAAVHRFADAYRWQMQDPRQLLLVYPIATRTGFFRAAGGEGTPLPWPSQSAPAVAAAILHGIQHDHRVVYPSRTFQLVMLLNHFLPLMHPLIQAIEQYRLWRWKRR